MLDEMEDIWSALRAVLPDDTDRARRLFELAAEGAQRGVALDDDGRQEMRDLADELNVSMTAAAGDADRILKSLSPEAAMRLSAQASTHASEAELMILMEHAGLDRFVWTVAAGGGGQENTDALVAEYLHASARWCAYNFIFSTTSAVDDELPMIIGVSADLEMVRRQMSTEVRFAWISRLIAKTIAEIVESDRDRYGGLSQVLTPCAVDELFDYLCGYPFVTNHYTLMAGSVALPDGPRALMREMSIDAGSLSNATFVDLVLGIHGEIAPYVSFDGNPFPVAIRQATLSPEHCLFELVRRSVPEEKDRSDLFEAVVSACLHETLPAVFTELAPPIQASIPNSDDPGEIDFALFSPDGPLIVGEAKAYLVTRRPDSVINSFGNQLNKASDQLRKRIDAIRSGATISASSGAPTSASGMRVIGIGVPMHSYATAIWNRESLQIIGALQKDIAIIPLHQLLLMASLMTDASDWCAYLDARFAMIDAGLQIFDEADLLVGYLGGTFGPVDDIPQRFGAKEKEVRFLPTFSADPQDAILVRPPRSTPLWRVMFWRICEKGTYGQD